MKNDPTEPRGKTLNNFLTVAQVACAAALVFWVVQLERQVGAAERELVELRRPLVLPGSVQAENVALRARVAELEAQLAASALAGAPAAVAPAAPANPMAALAANMNNPAMRNLMASSQKRMLEARFAELFTQLQFSPEQRARFIDLNAEALAATTDIGLKLAAGNLSAAERESLRQQTKGATEVVEAKIREFFADDNKFAIYKQYTEQQVERTQVNALKASLAQSGQAPLSAEQSTALTDIMYTERKSFSFTPSQGADPANPAAGLTAESIATRIREQEALQNRIADRAAAVLTPEQQASLRRDQANRLEGMKSSMEMARQMLGGAQPAPK